MAYILFLLFQFIFLLIFIAVMFSLLYSNFKGAPWVKSPDKNIDALLKLVKIPMDASIIELGCGTGGVLRRLCTNPTTSGLGIDINPLLIFIARIIAKHNKQKNVQFRTSSVYDVSLKKFTIVYLFLMPKMLEKLVPQFNRDLKKDTLIISLGFKIPGLDNKLTKTINTHPYTTHLYKM